MRRVVVTGMGAVTPIGTGVEKYWENVKKKTEGPCLAVRMLDMSFF